MTGPVVSRWIVGVSLAAVVASAAQVLSGSAGQGLFLAALCAGVCGVAALIDVATRRIPNALTYPALALGLGANLVAAPLLGAAGVDVALVWTGAAAPGDALLGFCLCAVLGIASFAGRGLGGGDVKLLAAVGALLGLTAVVPVLVNALLAALIIGLGDRALRGALLRRLQAAAGRLLVAVGRRPGPAQAFGAAEAPFGLALLVGLAASAFIDPRAPLGPAPPWADRPPFDGLAAALVALSAVAAALVVRLARRWRGGAAGDLARSSRGTIVVETALVLPVVLVAVGAVIQIALLAGASLVVRYAAFAGARSAIVRFEHPGPAAAAEALAIEPGSVDRAARLVLASLSPRLEGGRSAGAEAIRRIHEAQNGPWGSRSFVDRMTYAVAASRVAAGDRSPVRPPDGPPEVTVTVEYDFLLTVPGLGAIPLLTRDAPAGVAGRTFPIRQSVRLQSTGARQSNPLAMAPVDGNSPVP